MDVLSILNEVAVCLPVVLYELGEGLHHFRLKTISNPTPHLPHPQEVVAQLLVGAYYGISLVVAAVYLLVEPFTYGLQGLREHVNRTLELINQLLEAYHILRRVHKALVQALELLYLLLQVVVHQ
jgi:hypothetical protein